jgi:hypothetical protein
LVAPRLHRIAKYLIQSSSLVNKQTWYDYPEPTPSTLADGIGQTSLLEKCGRVMTSKKGGFVDWAEDNMKKLGGVPCPVLEMVASPVLDEYRNKCEFTIGTAADGKVAVFNLCGLCSALAILTASLITIHNHLYRL